LCFRTFVETYDPTLEGIVSLVGCNIFKILINWFVDSYRKQMTVDDEEAILNIYDTAGQEDFRFAFLIRKS